MNKLVLISFAILATAVSAQAVTIFEIESINTPSGSAAHNEDGDVIVDVYTRGAGVTQASGGTFNSQSWNEGTSLATALAAENYITWGFSTASAYDLTDMSVRYDRSGTGPAEGMMQISVNGGLFEDVFADADINASGEENLNIDLSSYTSVSSATFRFVGWTASGSGGTFDFENTANINGNSFQLTGTEAVPEPATMVVLAAAGLAAASRRKRK